MVEGYCVKCRTKREMKDTEDTTMKSRGGEMAAMKGKCTTCNTNMYKIIGKKKPAEEKKVS